MGKMVTDIKGAIDAISNLHFVDNSKVFVTGYSLGGTVALLSAALDDRIAGVVSVAGFTPFRTNTTNRGTEGIKSFSHLHGLIPQLGFFVGFEKHIPIDFDQIIASIAPRPVLLIAPLHDKDSFPDDIKNCVSKTETIFKLYTAENNIHLYMPNDHNRFSKISRQKIYDWLANYK